MYEKPKVERFGSFRELTRVGFSGSCDGYTVTSNTDGTTTDGNNLYGASGACQTRS